MRLTPLVPVVLAALPGLGATAPSAPSDLRIAVVLVLEKNKCVVRFADPRFKEKESAVAYTGHAVIWQVQSNGCGEKKKEKPGGKALGLKHLKFKSSGAPSAWLKDCSRLDLVPATYETPPALQCTIPREDAIVGIYQYEIDGDSVEPADPDLDVKKGH